MKRCQDHAISVAIQALDSGEIKSVRAAAKRYGIPRSTLRSQLAGCTNSRVGHQHLQRLSPEQEEYLANWIIELDHEGNPPSHARVREMAVQILRTNNDYKPLGKDWVRKFIQRNPKIKSVVGKRIETARIEGTQPETLEGFLNLFESVQTRYNVRVDDTWNMDEHGIALGVCKNTRVLGDAEEKRTLVKAPGGREWVTILETVSASGRCTKPLVVFRGKYIQSSWFQDDQIPDWHYTASDNGWTSNDIGIKWLNDIFLVETQPVDDGHRILILDGHGSHVSTEFLWICKQNKVHAIFLPAHSSHVLQPLDLSVFSSMKAHYRGEISGLSFLDDAAPVKKHRFVTCYEKARHHALVSRTIRSGWKAAGLVPFDPQKVLASSQLRVQPSTEDTEPTTPPNEPTQTEKDSNPLLNTPHNPRDMYRALEKLDEEGILNREQRGFLRKTGKAFAINNVERALLQASNRRLNSQLETFRDAKAKKRVEVDPNTKFANIEAIKRAQEEAEALDRRNQQGHPDVGTKKAAAAILEAGLKACMIEWRAW